MNKLLETLKAGELIDVRIGRFDGQICHPALLRSEELTEKLTSCRYAELLAERPERFEQQSSEVPDIAFDIFDLSPDVVSIQLPYTGNVEALQQQKMIGCRIVTDRNLQQLIRGANSPLLFFIAAKAADANTVSFSQDDRAPLQRMSINAQGVTEILKTLE
jgi:hypothetical protein